MPSNVAALAAQAADTPLARTTIPRRDLREHDVLVDIAFCGICHSDIHQARDEWGSSIFPMVPGHEIAGTVAAVGSGVTSYAVGERVGVGCYVDSCRECENCLAGEEQYCLKGEVQTYNSHAYDGEAMFGGYSTQIVVDEHYVLRIPEGIALDVAAPLLCAGITLWTPLKVWNVGPGTKVAILGMGGLGHMGVKLAHAMGAEVTVLSQTTSKQQDGLRFGADHYHATSDRATFTELAGSFDLIINTVAVNLDMDRYLRLLRLDGTLVNVGIPEHPDTYKASSLIGGRRRLAGSLIGGVGQTQAMLDFCAEHGIVAEIEVISVDDVNEAYERVIKSDVRYRFVIDIATLRGGA